MVNTTSFLTGVFLPEGQDPENTAVAETVGNATLLPSSTVISLTVYLTFDIDESDTLTVTNVAESFAAVALPEGVLEENS